MWRSSKRRLLKGLCCMWPGKGSLGGRGRLDSTWSRQAPVTFLFLVANENSDFCKDDSSSSYIHKRRAKENKRNNKDEKKNFVLPFLESWAIPQGTT
jgi:hypothetical protein